MSIRVSLGNGYRTLHGIGHTTTTTVNASRTRGATLHTQVHPEFRAERDWCVVMGLW